MPSWMKAREVAMVMSVSEFVTIASWLDCIHGKAARHFGVLEVWRRDGKLQMVKVILENDRIVKINAEQVRKDFAQKQREQREVISDSIA